MRISIDANALVFLIDRDAGERHKRALEMLDGASIADGVLTLQVLGEFLHAVIRKGKLSADGAYRFLTDWREVFRCTPAPQLFWTRCWTRFDRTT